MDAKKVLEQRNDKIISVCKQAQTLIRGKRFDQANKSGFLNFMKQIDFKFWAHEPEDADKLFEVTLNILSPSETSDI
jgi:hypothetical protein